MRSTCNVSRPTARQKNCGGAYSGVAADEDARGTPYLTAIEADGTTAKRVDEELSEGTRDQLFLALRLVMVEEYAKESPCTAVHRR